MRPQGSRPPLVLRMIGDAPLSTDVATGKHLDWTADEYLPAIEVATDRTIVIIIDSPGGSGVETLKLYRALRNHPCAVHAHIIGRCSSSAPIIALAADRRVVAPDATVFLHRPRLVWTKEKAAQLRTWPEDRRRALANHLFALENVLAGIIAERTGCGAETARQWMKAERKFTAAEAIQCGIAHEIDATRVGSREERIARIETRYGGLQHAA